MSEEKKKSTVQQYVIAFVVIIIGSMLIYSMVSDASKTKDKEPVVTHEEECDKYKINAGVMAERFVKTKLEFPESAEFPPILESPAVTCEGKTFKVTHWVNASNAFGVKQKLFYAIELDFLEGEWNKVSSWKEKSFQFFK